MASMVRRFVNLHVLYQPDPARTRRRGGGGSRSARRFEISFAVVCGVIVPSLRLSSDPGVHETGERLMASEFVSFADCGEKSPIRSSAS
jgi:hypothetical protein